MTFKEFMLRLSFRYGGLMKWTSASRSISAGVCSPNTFRACHTHDWGMRGSKSGYQSTMNPRPGRPMASGTRHLHTCRIDRDRRQASRVVNP